MMTSLQSPRGPVKTKRLLYHVLLSYLIGLGINLPLFFAYKTGETPCPPGLIGSKCYDTYQPWLKVSFKRKTPDISCNIGSVYMWIQQDLEGMQWQNVKELLSLSHNL